MLPHYLGNLKVQICRFKPHLHQRNMLRCNMLRATCCLLRTTCCLKQHVAHNKQHVARPRNLLPHNMLRCKRGFSVFAHVWEQMLDTLSNFMIITTSIQPYEWNFPFMTNRLYTIFNFILQFYDKFEIMETIRISLSFSRVYAASSPTN